MDHLARLKKFERTLLENSLGGFVVTHPANLRYLCGYTGSNGLLLFLGGRRVFFTDGRYTEQAREEVKGARLVISKGPLLQDAARIIAKPNAGVVGFEADYTTFATAGQMRKLVSRPTQWKPTSGLIMRQRMIKDAEELRIMADAVEAGRGRLPAGPGNHPARGSRVRGRRNIGVCGATGGRRWNVVRNHRGGGQALRPARTVAPPVNLYPVADSWWWIPVLYCGAIVLT